MRETREEEQMSKFDFSDIHDMHDICMLWLAQTSCSYQHSEATWLIHFGIAVSTCWLTAHGISCVSSAISSRKYHIMDCNANEGCLTEIQFRRDLWQYYLLFHEYRHLAAHAETLQ